MRKILFFWIILLASFTSIVYAEIETHGIIFDTNASQTSGAGVKVSFEQNTTIYSFAKHPRDAGTWCSILDLSNSSLVYLGTWSNNQCENISVRVYTDRYYYFLSNASGSWVRQYKPGVTLPIDSGIINWTKAYNINGEADGHLMSITNITYGLAPNTPVSVLTTIFNHSVNLTSDQGTKPCGYNTSSEYTLCGPTEDGTPTIRFSTFGSASCKLWNSTGNWSTLDSIGVPDCSTTGQSSHVCTMSEALSNGSQMLYLSCKSGSLEVNDFSYYLSNKFTINITAPIRTSQAHANDAIELGITSSAVWPGALIYTSQPVYIRLKNNTQSFATFDKVAIFGNQRWAFNYRINGEQSIGTFYNITPVFYYWEGGNLSFKQVVSRVSTLINSTKN
jgi:hypothetical protein